MTTVTADHVASSTGPCTLSPAARVSPYVVAEEGYCLAVRALADKEVYNQIEGIDGVFRTIRKGEILLGALGERQALKGYSGRIPRQVSPGDTLHVLNMGGILGLCAADHPDLGPALPVEVLGAVVHGEPARHARIQEHALEGREHLSESAPLVFVSGTAMNTGKTFAAAALVEGLTARGFRVAAAKLTGAALQRDVRAMTKAGAVCSASFIEAGRVATTGREVIATAKGIIAHLNGCSPDVLVLELGDGIIGPYGVDGILRDMELQRLTAAHVLAGRRPRGRLGRRPDLPPPVPLRARRRRRPDDRHRGGSPPYPDRPRRPRRQRPLRARRPRRARRRRRPRHGRVAAHAARPGRWRSPPRRPGPRRRPRGLTASGATPLARAARGARASTLTACACVLDPPIPE